MPELQDLLEREAVAYAPPPDLLDRVRRRGRQRERNRRVGSAMAGVLLVAVSVASLARLLPRDEVLFVQPSDPFVGSWVSIDSDGSNQTMTISAADGPAYEVVIADDSATVCSGVPSTMTGTGRMDGANLVVPAPTLECEDGTTPRPVDGSSIEDAVRNYTLTHDTGTDTVSDNLSVRWNRPDAGAEELPQIATSDGMWPQSTSAELRDAQERADAGDPDVAWQVAPALYNDAAPPGEAAIFTRYVRAVLGWESFRWGDATGLTWNADCGGGNAGPGCTSYEIGFARCATGQPNPLYPDARNQGDVPHALDGTTCAPTVDDATYETVTLVVRQPVKRGPNGIWIVSDSYPGGVLRQAAPPSEAQVARVLDTFLQARVDGQGAENNVASSSGDIPVLYAASNGERYDRFDYDLTGPLWPTGSFDVTTRLHTAGGNTVVEQQFELDGQGEDRLLLSFRHASTIENGQPRPEPYGIFDGEVTFGVAPPWYGFFDYGPNSIALNHPELDGDFAVLPDPLPVDTGCQKGSRPDDADALARSIAADPDLQATKPVDGRVGRLRALRMDVVATAEASVCSDAGTPLAVSGGRLRNGPFLEAGHRMRLYLVDLPKGSSTPMLAIAFVAPDGRFDDVVRGAEPILRSFEFRPR